MEQFDEKKLIDTAKELIYTPRMDMAARGEATVQMLSSTNGRRYKLSVVIERIDDSLKSDMQVDESGKIKIT